VAPQIFTRARNWPRLSSAHAGRPHVGLCPIFLVWFVTIAPRILIVAWMHLSSDVSAGAGHFSFCLLSTCGISKLSVKLLICAQRAMLLNSAWSESMLIAAITKFILSAYLQTWLSLVTSRESVVWRVLYQVIGRSAISVLIWENWKTFLPRWWMIWKSK